MRVYGSQRVICRVDGARGGGAPKSFSWIGVAPSPVDQVDVAPN